MWDYEALGEGEHPGERLWGAGSLSWDPEPELGEEMFHKLEGSQPLGHTPQEVA